MGWYATCSRLDSYESFGDVAGMDKRALISSLKLALEQELAAAARLARDTAEAANHPEARPEGDKDTRKLELSYLAAGQAERAKELESALAVVSALEAQPLSEHEPLRVGAAASLSVDGKPQSVFLCSVGGGLKLRVEASEINVVTPQSPLGRELIGRAVGDTFVLRVAGREREVEIIAIY